MRLIWTDRWGRRHIKQFNTMHELFSFIVWNYPLFQVAKAVGAIK